MNRKSVEQPDRSIALPKISDDKNFGESISISTHPSKILGLEVKTSECGAMPTQVNGHTSLVDVMKNNGINFTQIKFGS